MVKVFDLDGTLLDSNGVWRGIDEQFVSQFGYSVTEEYNEYVTHSIFPDAARFTREYYHLPVSEAEIMSGWLQLAQNAYANELPLKPGVRSYLRQCQAEDERIVLYTSSEPSLCMAALRRHGLTETFEQLYFAQSLKLEKKYSASFTALSELLQEDVKDCLLFDDSPVACASAKAAGWQVCGVYDAFFASGHEAMKQCCDRFIPGFDAL